MSDKKKNKKPKNDNSPKSSDVQTSDIGGQLPPTDDEEGRG